MMKLTHFLQADDPDERDEAVFTCECGHEEVHTMGWCETIAHAEAVWATFVCPCCGRYGEAE